VDKIALFVSPSFIFVGLLSFPLQKI